jgi:DNA-binding MarR family transcriptional regulator
LRYIQAMVEEGLIETVDDPLDRRRKFLSLSAAAAGQMALYLNSQHLPGLKAA